jgi:hypothetical protein
MALRPAGSIWLKEHFQLPDSGLTHNSFIGSNPSVKMVENGTVEQVYGLKYAPSANHPLNHVEFALKYDDLSLDFLQKVLKRIPEADIIAYIEQTPSGKYARIIGFFYEFLINKILVLNKTIRGNYFDLLEKSRYITGNVIKNTKWRINDNLPGTASFCPVIRNSRLLENLLSQDIPSRIEQLKNDFSPEVFRRATQYLYNKETRSSYEIEHLQPSSVRVERFLKILGTAGLEDPDKMLDEDRLVKLQLAIVDARFAPSGYRNFQNYIGQSLPNDQEIVHYISPPPVFISSLMAGLKETARKTTGIYSVIRAAIISFGFVYIHPFEDGNGRLHRFLIHDLLAMDGLVPRGLIIPVSAHMLSHIDDYDQLLEKISKPLMQRVKYDKNAEGEIVVRNPAEIIGYYRYPDLTEHCIYLARVLSDTISDDMSEELRFIQHYDEVKKAIQTIADMPDKEIDHMIMFLHQNKGTLPKRRRDYFSRLTDAEIDRMQLAFRTVFYS